MPFVLLWHLFSYDIFDISGDGKIEGHRYKVGDASVAYIGADLEAAMLRM